MTRPPIPHEIEHRPIQAGDGRLHVQGWCAADRIRLTINGRELSPTERFPRPDAGDAPPDHPAGFRFATELPPGVHLAEFAAESTDGAWEMLRRFVVVSFSPPLCGAVEFPISTGRITKAGQIHGWCAHPYAPLASVYLNYGNQSEPCQWGLARDDIRRHLPYSPDAAHCGFQTLRYPPPGTGPARLKATTGDGAVLLLPLPLELELDASLRPANPASPDRVGASPMIESLHRLGDLHRGAATTDSVRRPSDSPLRRLLFVLYGDALSNSAYHVINLARELGVAGWTCEVAVLHHDPHAREFAGLHISSYEQVLAKTDTFDVVHAWTPRARVAGFCRALRQHGRARRLLVHLEDNEAHLASLRGSDGGAGQANSPGFAHDLDLLHVADGVTTIIESLQRFVPDGKPCHTFWPAADSRCFFPRPRPDDFRRSLGWTDADVVLVYPGNVHIANVGEMRELYAAVGELNRRGRPCTLIRTGSDIPGWLPAEDRAVLKHVIHLGVLPCQACLGPLYALADFLVQPGRPDEFNDYRFPSKLPEFFASGRPVILPATNLGKHVRSGEDAWVLPVADRQAIADAIENVLDHPALRAKLGHGAAAFAERHFSWTKTADTMAAFYRSVLPR